MNSVFRKAYVKLLARNISKSFFMNDQERYSRHQIGDWSYGEPEVLSWNEGSNLIIGRYCSIANGVTILLGGEHRIDWITTYPFREVFSGAAQFQGHPRTKGDVIIGNDVWIGRDALILSGVKVGNGAVIGARSVIAKDVAAYSIVSGNPAQQMRFRFSEDDIRSLEQIAWWDWPHEMVIEALPLLLSPDITHFISKYGRKSGDDETA
jgi:virginiamycin A acetyltransferase